MDLVHLQCHIGSDTIAWARRGARVVGLDFSDEAIAVATDLSKRCELDVEWVQANVYDAVEALRGRTFDGVYTGVGALGWLPDLKPWAEIVHSLLKPGGVLYLVELHPMWVALVSDGTTIYAVFANGIVRAVDLGGKAKWTAFIDAPQSTLNGTRSPRVQRPSWRR